jgi:hypothetical protein
MGENLEFMKKKMEQKLLEDAPALGIFFFLFAYLGE